MPRAKDISFDSDDVRIAREYIAAQSKDVLGVTLEVKENTLLNPASNMTYAVALSPGTTNNAFSMGVDLMTGMVLFGGPSVWVAILDVSTSEMLLISAADVAAMVSKAIANENQFQGIRLEVGSSGQFGICHINRGWASTAGVIKKVSAMNKAGETYQFFRGSALRSPEKFCHLHVHSYYSMLDGVSSPEEIVEAAYLNGQPGVALTDHGNMMGTFKFWKAAKDYGIKPLMGCEVYVVDDASKKYVDVNGANRRFEYHQTLIAMNQEGWENLCELTSSAGRNNYYYVPRTDHASIFKHKAGIICLSGCFKGMVAHHMTQFPPEMTHECPWLNYNPDWARKVMQTYQSEFGDRYYCELHSNNFARYMDAMPRVSQLADELGVPKVIANDAHFMQEHDALIQRLMTRISSSKVDEVGDGAESVPYYLKCRSEITHPLFTPDMYDRTVEIMDRCNVDFSFKEYLFPEYDMQADVDWVAYQKQIRQEMNSEEAEHFERK